MEDKQKLYTTPQAASMIGFSSSRLRQLIMDGIAKPADQIGGTWLFTVEEIEKLRKRKRTPGPTKKK